MIMTQFCSWLLEIDLMKSKILSQLLIREFNNSLLSQVFINIDFTKLELRHIPKESLTLLISVPEFEDYKELT